MPALSIIIPTYNSSETILDALKSIKSQSFQDLEVLVMDGASQDDTVQLVESFIADYPKVSCHVEKDDGVYNAMNKGISLAKGDYLYFFGSDDQLESGEVLTEVFQHIEDVDFLYGNVRFKHSGEIYSGASSFEKLVYRRISICHQAVFYSKRVFELLGGYDERYFIHADHDFNIKCFENAELKKKYIDIVIALFNERGLSGINSNEDGYKDVLTQKIIQGDKELQKILEERDKLEHKLNSIKSSKSYKLAKKLSSLFSFKKSKL